MDPDKQNKKKMITVHKTHVILAVSLLVLFLLVIALKPVYSGLSSGDNAATGSAAVDTSSEQECEQESQEKDEQIRRCEEHVVVTKSKLYSDEAVWKEQVGSLQTQITQNQAQYDELLEAYNRLLSTSAYSICCKERVDDTSVDSYTISDGKITCGSGEESILSCP